MRTCCACSALTTLVPQANTAFYTGHVGVNWQHASRPFYRDSLISDMKQVHALFARARESSVRVVPLVSNILTQIVSIDNLKRFLVSDRYCIIALVNINDLRCAACSRVRSGWLSIFARPPPPLTIESADSSAEWVRAGRKLSSGSMAKGSSPSPSHRSSSCLSPLFSCFARPRRYRQIPEPDFIGHYIVLIGYEPSTDTFLYRDPGTDQKLCGISTPHLEKARGSPGTDHDLIVIKMA